MNRIEMESIFRLSDILSHATQTIKVMECSALIGTGLAGVLQWVQLNTKPSAQTA